MSTNGLRDLTALAADDAAAERLIAEELPDAELLDLIAFGAAWDAGAGMETDAPRVKARIPLRVLLPVNAALLAIIIAWLML